MTNDELVKNYGDLLQHCDMSLDASIDELIKEDGLTWRPWIGADWKDSLERILIVGESHYATTPDADDAAEKIKAWEVDSDGTREIVFEAGVGDWYYSRFFGNLHRAFLGEDIHNEKRVALWRNLAFCNFIQRPMRDQGERPLSAEFFGGWRHFMELVKILRPNLVLFAGVTAAKHFDGAMTALGIKHSIEFDECINGAYPARFSFAFDGVTTEMVAIRHVSQFFSWEDWKGYLEKSFSEGVAFLRDIVKCVPNGVTSSENMAAPRKEDVGPKDVQGSSLEGLPTWLNHKPIVACNYQEINDALGNFDYDDTRYISVGRAQYNPDEVSVKLFRMGGSGRWSRQSEEIPIQRLPYMMAILLAAIRKTQNPNVDFDSGLNEKLIAPQDMEILKEQVQAFGLPIRDGLLRVKELLNNINLDELWPQPYKDRDSSERPRMEP